MIPAESIRHFSVAFVMGAGLGLYYGFLRPLRRRHPHLSDLVFLAGVFWAWLYLCFGVCRGDIRLGCCSGLLLGGLTWELTVGKLLRPVFAGFWSVTGKILTFLIRPFGKIFKKIRKIYKFPLVNRKKNGYNKL